MKCLAVNTATQSLSVAIVDVAWGTFASATACGLGLVLARWIERLW